MAETLLTPSSIKLFGRVMGSLTYNDDTSSSVLGCNNFLQHQLSCHDHDTSFDAVVEIELDDKGNPKKDSNGNTIPTGRLQVKKSNVAPLNGMLVSTATAGVLADNTTTVKVGAVYVTVVPTPLSDQGQADITFKVTMAPQFARIYTFSYEGAVYPLPRPSIFLVHGPGKVVDVTGNARNHFPGINNIGRTTLDQSGVMAREWEFSAPQASDDYDLRLWEYEKCDFSIRLDMEAGQLEEILLVAALRAGADMADRSTGIRSGASLAGASLSGASLSGASLSGASLSGASLSGASLRGR
jgi:hypothetical protein